MYSTTKFNWFDQSQIEEDAVITELNNRPLFSTVITSDKGPEDVRTVYGDNFYKLYGKDIDFEKHGQPLLQASRIIDAGGSLLLKRLVSDDATLSNLVLVAMVTKDREQKKDENGNLLYIDSLTGEATTEATSTTTMDAKNKWSLPVEYFNAVSKAKAVTLADDNAEEGEGGGTTTPTDDPEKVTVQNLPLMITKSATVKWSAVSVRNCKTLAEVKEEAAKMYSTNEDGGVYPLYIVTDIGRNDDCKAIRITPDYDISRSTTNMFYRIDTIEGTSSSEYKTVLLNPEAKYDGKSYAVGIGTMDYITLDTIDGVLDNYVEAIADGAGMSVEEMINYDIINCTNRKGISISGLTVDEEGINLGATYGIALDSGSNGTQFGDGCTTDSQAFIDKAIGFFEGKYDEQVYDVDVNKICAVVDANFPDAVKDAIAKFCKFREDCMFFEDLGLGLTTFDAIYNKRKSLYDTKFAAPYMTSYQVYDPYSNKRIDVTMMYDFAPLLVRHFNNNPSVPLAGEVNGMVITSAIPGTVNYIPRNTPKVDQKALLDEARINYATYTETDGPLVVSSLYTSQSEYTQLSYVNNVLAIQQVMRALRTNCPKNRFRFTKQNDFTAYTEACETVLQAFRENFDTLELTYLADKIKENQKIYYAAIKFAFNNWTQAEIFDLYAIKNISIDE